MNVLPIGRRALAALTAMSAVGCGGTTPSNATVDASRPTVVRVQTARATARDVADARSFFATLVAEQQASVAPLVAGRVERRFVERGDRVRAGDPLFRLRDADYRDQSAQAAAALGQARTRSVSDAPEVRSARATAEAAEEALRRLETLATQGSASAQELTRARAEVTAARAQLAMAEQATRAARFATAQAQAQLSATQRAVGDAIVRAPFDGEVIERRAEVGDFAPAGVPIITLQRRDALRARFNAGQADSFVLRAGQRATVLVDGLEGAQMPAVLRYVSPASAELTRALTIEATIDRVDPRVRPGQFATVRVELDGRQRRVAIPRRAVRSLAGVYRAFVLRDRHLDERVLFVPEEPDGEEALVARGVDDGDEVVVDPTDAMRDGQEATR
ncbi:MAG: efflux RND transporter periplasmic adaptor subunit [Myxococcales bacterium]|nr:efflux RND transporter periplasmic adaptor subunit [Myxococcales bacterium]